jgi:mono/diheme cytochrome c family protein
MQGIFEYFRKRSDTPVEQRPYGGIYLVLSGLLFIATMWAVVDEVSTRRPWKQYQEEYLGLSRAGWSRKLDEERAAVDSSALAALRARRDSLQASMKSPGAVEAAEKVDRIDHELLNAARVVTFTRSKGDEAYYFWKKSIHEGEESASYRDKAEKFTAELRAASHVVDSLTAIRRSTAAVIDTIRARQEEVDRRIAGILKGVQEAERKLDIAANSPIRIRQVMMNGFDRSNFGTPKARIDRCQTCHAGWKDDMMKDAPEPFTKHSHPELLKIHDPELFGCTPCHRGQGPALTAGLAHGDDDPYWEWPILTGKEVYASCNGCHENELFLRSGDRFNRGKQILFESGCYGCHEIKGFLDLPNIGPDLGRIGEKLDPQWTLRWVRNPKDYNPHTRMPDFRFDDRQAGAITAFLMGLRSGAGRAGDDRAWAGGDPGKGKTIVETVGCKGCHVVGDDDRMRKERGFSFDIAPELTRAGSKLDPAWLFRWVKNPKDFRPTTRMPDLRLSDQEARDIVAYIMSLRDNRTFTPVPVDLGSAEVRKQGYNLIREYGCTGCHAIPGLEKENRVSVSLSNIGRKRIDEIDFGDTKVPHTWDDWFFGKLKDSRQYATDRIVSKMPVFSLADSEIAELRTLMRGMTREAPEQEYRRPVDRIVQDVEAGRRLTGEYHCINCHQIEEIGGSIRAVLDGEGMAPPYLFPEGSKVQEEWLHSFLKAPTTIRPWLKVRMPTFGLSEAEITTITKYFLGLHNKTLELHDYAAYIPDPRYVAVGGKLFGDLQCLSCHYTGTVPEGRDASDLAPDLSMAKFRLKPEWVDQWIAHPDSIAPGTRMPNFFTDFSEPSPYSDELGGDVMKQIEALRAYIWSIRRH